MLRGASTSMLVCLFLVYRLLPLTCALSVAVTHAAGRMGVSVLGQLRESSPDLQIVAIVRSEEEEARLNLDLCGAVLSSGKMTPLRSLKEDLGITCLVIPPNTLEESDLLTKAFSSVTCAILLSAAHADFGEPRRESLMTGASYISRGTAAVNDALRGSEPVTVRVPPLEQARASRRLSFEISAAKKVRSGKEQGDDETMEQKQVHLRYFSTQRLRCQLCGCFLLVNTFFATLFVRCRRARLASSLGPPWAWSRRTSLRRKPWAASPLFPRATSPKRVSFPPHRRSRALSYALEPSLTVPAALPFDSTAILRRTRGSRQTTTPSLLSYRATTLLGSLLLLS